jgi:predicted dehydrogenase
MPGNVVRFGVIGTNFISDWVVSAAKNVPSISFVAVYSRAEETGRQFAAKHGIADVFVSLETMLGSPLIDAVYIASPNFCHCQQALLCIAHNKHVLCEKPLASNAREATAMIQAAREKGVVLMEAMKSTLTPNFLSLQANLNKIGVVRRYFACYCQYSSRYDKLKQGIVLNAFNPAFSNGALMDIGIYTIYPMVVLFGKPSNIKADGLILSSGADGQGAVTFEYDGMNATILYSKIADSYLPTELQGESGNLILDRINIINKVTFVGRPDHREEDVTVPMDKNEYCYELEEFAGLIQQGKLESANNSLRNSITTMEILDEIRAQLGIVFPADSDPTPP